MAYQGYGYGDKPDIQEKIKDLYHMIAGDFYPDLTIILDIDTTEGLQRSCTRSGNTEQRFEGMDLEFHNRLRQAFLKFAIIDPKRYIVVDGSKNPNEIHHEIMSIVRERLLCPKQ
jgi:dTMP kinase